MYELILDFKKKLKNEEGAIAATFAILISSVLIIALFVMVFDVSSVYAERRVLQNASDASSLALSQECATDGTGAILNVNSTYPGPVCQNSTYALDFTTKYANLNSPDNLSKVTEACGSIPLQNCNSLNSGQFECKSVDPKYKFYSRVKTETLQVTGSYLTALFTSLNDPNSSQVTVVSCSQSAWGKAGFAPVIFPIALPICDFGIRGTRMIQDFTSNSPVVVGGCSLTDLNGDQFNYTSPTKGFNLLSGFGCPGLSSPRSTFVGDTLQIESSLTQVESGCPNGQFQFYYQLSTLINKIVFVPVVTSVICQSGSVNCQGNYQFQVASFYSFKFLGGKFKNRGRVGSGPPCPTGDPCQNNSSWPPVCDSTRNCIYGTFEKAVVPGSDVSLDPSFPAVGAMAVQLLP